MNIKIVPKKFPQKVYTAGAFVNQLEVAKERKQDFAHMLHLKDVVDGFPYIDLSKKEEVENLAHKAFSYLGLKIQNFQEESDFQSLLDFKKMADKLYEALKVSYISTLAGAKYGVEASSGVCRIIESNVSNIQKQLITPFLDINKSFLNSPPTVFELFSKLGELAKQHGNYPQWFQNVINNEEYQNIEIPNLINEWSKIFSDIVEGFAAIDKLNQKYIKAPEISPLINWRIVVHNNMVETLDSKNETVGDWERKAQILVKEQALENNRKQKLVFEILEEKLNGLADLRYLLEKLRKNGIGEKYFKEVLKFTFKSKGFEDLTSAIGSFFIKGGIKDASLNENLVALQEVLKIREEETRFLNIETKEFIEEESTIDEEKLFDFLASNLYLTILRSVKYRNFFVDESELEQARNITEQGIGMLDIEGDIKFTNSIKDLLEEVFRMHNDYGKYGS